GEGAALHDAAVALKDIMLELGIAVDGGKDSLSMAALAPSDNGADETVKAPGSLVVSAYVTCPDITKTVTPDLRLPGTGRLLYVDLGGGHQRLGGSALAQVYGQIGDVPPDVEDPGLLARAFNAVQSLLEDGIVAAGHDRSDGGLVTTLLEMAFAGNCGIDIQMEGEAPTDPLAQLFAEELGLIIEVAADDEEAAREAFARAEVPCSTIGHTVEEPSIRIQVDDQEVLAADMRDLRDLWEETSFRLDRLQAEPDFVEQEQTGLRHRTGPRFVVPFDPRPTAPAILESRDKIPVAILREEGSNGDREMASAVYAAGFEPWDIVMTDLLSGRVELDRFRGVVAVGGFSYADVMDSAKGWAGVIRLNDALWRQFQDFYRRPDTFSLGICNGCQLLALLGWVPWTGIADEEQPRFVQNACGRFESRFVAVQIQQSPAVLLRGMEEATLGIWVAHGEGQALFPEKKILDQVLADGLAPVRFVDDTNQVTEAYPFNPNGSPHGIAGLCTPDGRHLVMMPHPERSYLPWQWGWMPADLRQRLEVSPWLQMFQNARLWCEENA
ncbi:MAG: phosphoribosylformylglycinamidine synthase subunit PurQ, partial [Thermoanaerobaculia bacterium]